MQCVTKEAKESDFLSGEKMVDDGKSWTFQYNPETNIDCTFAVFWSIGLSLANQKNAWLCYLLC